MCSPVCPGELMCDHRRLIKAAPPKAPFMERYRYYQHVAIGLNVANEIFGNRLCQPWLSPIFEFQNDRPRGFTICHCRHNAVMDWRRGETLSAHQTLLIHWATTRFTSASEEKIQRIPAHRAKAVIFRYNVTTTCASWGQRKINQCFNNAAEILHAFTCRAIGARAQDCR